MSVSEHTKGQVIIKESSKLPSFKVNPRLTVVTSADCNWAKVSNRPSQCVEVHASTNTVSCIAFAAIPGRCTFPTKPLRAPKANDCD